MHAVHMSQEKVFQNPLTVLNYEGCAQIVRNGKDTILLITQARPNAMNMYVCPNDSILQCGCCFFSTVHFLEFLCKAFFTSSYTNFKFWEISL